MLADALQAFLRQYDSGRTCWIGFSGGMDSHVLLSLCHGLSRQLPVNFHVVHVNHGLSRHAQQWAGHCERVCREYGFAFTARELKLVHCAGDSLEAAAREARYQILAEILEQGDMLLTAHHQDDQAETLLLQLLRGAGPKGLAAMPQIKPFARGFHGRPLLAFPRESLREYAALKSLEWIEDESNENRQLSRNFIRHDIMPLLASRWPSAAETLSRSAANCAEAQSLLDDYAAGMYANCQGSKAGTLSAAKLLQFAPAQQRLVLRYWIRQCGHSVPDSRKIAGIQTDVLTAAWDRMPYISWGNIELRRYRDDLYLLARKAEAGLQDNYAWDLSVPLRLPGLGALRAVAVQGKGLRTDIHDVSVRFRQGGEIIDLPGRGRHTLKNLFHQQNVLPWERGRVPLIFAGDRLAAAVGYFIDREFAAGEAETGWEIKLERDGG